MKSEGAGIAGLRPVSLGTNPFVKPPFRAILGQAFEAGAQSTYVGPHPDSQAQSMVLFELHTALALPRSTTEPA